MVRSPRDPSQASSGETLWPRSQPYMLDARQIVPGRGHRAQHHVGVASDIFGGGDHRDSTPAAIAGNSSGVAQVLSIRVTTPRSRAAAQIPTVPGASLVWSVESTRWPVSAALTADLRGLEVADLADHDDVRVLAQEGAQRRGEVEPDVLVHLHLVDAGEVELHGILGGGDVRVDLFSSGSAE